MTATLTQSEVTQNILRGGEVHEKEQLTCDYYVTFKCKFCRGGEGGAFLPPNI